MNLSVSVNKCGGSTNTINDSNTPVCFLRVSTLMAWLNETRLLVQHEWSECKHGSNECGWNSK